MWLLPLLLQLLVLVLVLMLLLLLVLVVLLLWWWWLRWLWLWLWLLLLLWSGGLLTRTASRQEPGARYERDITRRGEWNKGTTSTSYRHLLLRGWQGGGPSCEEAMQR